MESVDALWCWLMMLMVDDVCVNLICVELAFELVMNLIYVMNCSIYGPFY
jgi:hypothetical protein